MSDSRSEEEWQDLLIIGIGNQERCDDGVGLVVARNLAAKNLPNLTVIEARGDISALTDVWKGAKNVILIDAVCSGQEPGTVHRLDARTERVPTGIFRRSCHSLGIGEAIEIARSMNQLPERVTVYAIDGKDFDIGIGLSREVVRAARRVVESIEKEVRAFHPRRRRARARAAAAA
ncbi:MAG: hydrogenase maturation protease [Rudaea sp.]